MKSLILLFSSSNDAAAEGLALSQNGWHVAVTGPNDGAEIRQDGEFVAKLASSWAVFASRQPLGEPGD